MSKNKNKEDRTKTNLAWNKLFDKYHILDEINANGFYRIKASTIKQEREPRLMAKFDHFSSLPGIFKDNNLSILPISRSEYIIGQFQAFQKVKYDKTIKPQYIEFPANITTIDPNNLYSESSALHCAVVSGMIDDVLGEEAVQTISGRMSSKEFRFNIDTKNGNTTLIHIKNSQVEIDGGYESDSQFMIVEAKKETVEDFMIRQLYYPYRLWERQTSKKIKPVFFTHSNDVFSFFIYDFQEVNSYNSLILVEQKHYTLLNEDIELDDILEVFETTKVLPEPELPFPQANSIRRLVDLLEKLYLGDLERDQITLTYDFDVRQTQYYTDAGRYLGLIEKYKDNNKQVSFRLTSEGKRILSLPYKKKYLAIVSKILEHQPFRMALQAYLTNASRPSVDLATDILIECQIYNVKSYETFRRRASTVLKWIEWILELQHKFD